MPETLTYPSRDLPVKELDVLIAGGGPAGAAAAIAAARDGARTLLVEQFGCLGGMATVGLVPAWCPFTDKEKPIVRGIGFEILEEMKGRMPHVPKDRYDWVPIDPEMLKRIYDRRVTEAGASVLFHTQPVDALTEDGRVTHAVIHNKAGLSAVRAKVFIDTTGDADLVARAGGEFEKGDPETGAMQPTTPCFVMGGVDSEKFMAWREEKPNRQNWRDALSAGRASGDLDLPPDKLASVAWQSPGTLGFNFAHVFDIDATDPAQLSRAMIEGRMIVEKIAAFMRKRCPGCERGVVAQTGVTIGVRETRRIVGDYKLVLDDYLARRSFDDEIARNSYYIDVHMQREESAKAERGDYDWQATLHTYGPGESHGIPYRCLIPRSLSNVLVAGRCISCDRQVQGSVRVMPFCLAMGEAAGCAAAMVTASGAPGVRDVDVTALREKLRAHGAYLP
jgi:hypothetical protein